MIKIKKIMCFALIMLCLPITIYATAVCILCAAEHE